MAIDDAVSLPALAAMLRQAESVLRDARDSDRQRDTAQYQILMGASRTMITHHGPDTTQVDVNLFGKIAPMYQVKSGDIQKEAQSANHVIRQVTDRLYRLGAAYGQWDAFDIEAYFDLSERQAERLITLTEQRNSVHVIFFADLLLPSYQAALAYFYDQWLPAYCTFWDQLYVQKPMGVVDSRFSNEVQPQMISHWQRVVAVTQQARNLLYDDMGFLTMSYSKEERARWKTYWSMSSTSGLAAALAPKLPDIPTLTLAFEFPLPTARQSGRQERLRRNRTYGQKTNEWLDV